MSIIGKPENLKSYPQHIWVCVQICVGKNFICVGQKSQHIYFSQHIYWYVFRYVLGINVQNISQYIYFLRPTHTYLFPIHIPTHISQNPNTYLNTYIVCKTPGPHICKIPTHILPNPNTYPTQPKNMRWDMCWGFHICVGKIW